MKKSLLVCALALAGIGSVHAAKITPVNINAPGVGLNDTTAATPVGLNPGVTVGEQRRIAYQFAADLWGAVLQSDVEIKVEAQFTALSCTATSGTLGSAGTKSIFSDIANGKPATWYGGALSNAISGIDQDDTDNDIRSNFNANLGTTGCLEGSAWYYGLDGKTPTGAISFLDVVMHEIGHGLNFQGFYDVTTGEIPVADFPTYGDVFSDNVFDNVSGLAWKSMTDAQRATAAVSDNLVWTGATVNAQVPAALGPLLRLTVSGTLNGSFNHGAADFGPAATPGNFNGAVVLATDGTANGSQACGALTNAAAVAGKIALVDRGTCAFTVKVKNAQNAGATAVLVADNVTGTPPGLGGADATITIPAVRISMGAGTQIKAASPGVNAAFVSVAGQFAGSDTAGRARLYAPTTRAPGSTFSHYDISHSPNALMEPAINQDLDANYRLDLTPALFQDLGWTLNSGSGLIPTASGGSCNTGVKVVRTPGLIAGANVQAAGKLCRTSTTTSAGFKACMAPFVSGLADAGLISSGPNSRIAICVK